MSKKIDLSGENNIPTHVVAVFGIIQKGDKYLIAKRNFSDPQAGGEWSIPSGKVEIEVGENVLEKSLKREIREEVGLEIDDRVTLLCNSGFTRVSGHNVISLTYLCKWKSGEAQALEDQEEVRWLTLKEALAFDLPIYTKVRFEALDRYLKSII